MKDKKIEHAALDSQYLRELKYDKTLDKSGFVFWTNKIRVVYLMIIMIVVGWSISLSSLPLESQPEVEIWIWAVSVVMPGASPETMEDLVTKKIEKEIAKVKWVDTITSNSWKWFATIMVQFKAWEKSKDLIRELKDKVDSVKKDLPEDAKDPVVVEASFSDMPFLTMVLAWNYDWFELRKYADKIKENLEWIDKISEVRISWWDEWEYEVAYNPSKLEALWVNIDTADQAIKSTNITFPIWDISIDKYKHNIVLDERFYTEEQLKNIVITKNWETWIIYLKDVADVKKVAKKRTTSARVSNRWEEPKNAITLSVVKKAWWSIVTISDECKKRIEEMKWWAIPKDVTINTIYDTAERIKLDIDQLTHDFIVTIILVLWVLYLFLWLRLSVIPALTIPIVFLMTFMAMAAFGLTLNFLSLFALILSLWLLVDDAILIIEWYHKYHATGKFTVREAMLLVLRDYKRVDTSTTLTVIWSFASMMFMTGIMWKFLFSLPFVITMTLFASLIVSLTIVPALTVFFQNKSWENIKSEKRKRIRRFLYSRFPILERLTSDVPLLSLSWFIKFYEKQITYILETKKRRRTTLIVMFLLFISAIALPATGILKSEFMPATDQDLMLVNIESEPGQKLEETSKIIKPVEELLMKEKNIDSFSVNVWSTASVGYWDSAAWENYAGITINLIKKEHWRKESSIVIAERLRKELAKIQLPWTKIVLEELKSWPPAWADFEMTVSWEDFATLDKILLELEDVLKTVPWAINISTSRKPVPLEFKLSFDSQKLSLNNVSLWQVAVFLRTAVDWTETTKIFKWTDEIVVRSKIKQDYVDTLEKIKNLKIKNQKWQYIYIKDLVSDNLEKSVSSIKRIDQKRIVSLYAAADKNKTSWQQLLAEFNKKLEEKNYKLPPWYKFVVWWENEENAKSIQSLLTSLAFAMLFIISTMILQFNSYKQALMSIAPIPLALVWVFYWLTLTGQTLSFPWLIWLVALFGMVSNHSIYLIDKINLNRKNWISFDESIIEAWVSRFEPVLLTSLTTIMWFIPMALVPGIWQSLAQSLVFWLVTSWILKMFLIPILYKSWIKDEPLEN